ncbi:MAG: ABC transporter ATP-binding protein [Planctomycetota bacterium]
MSEIVIRARELSKVYRLYARPHHRILDLFGLLRGLRIGYGERSAVEQMNIEIHAGERIAIIGRNGAGKSTFLKLVTGVARPTSGELQVTGRVHALLQIGTGFHPEFTGRENVLSHLAQLGISGADARRTLDEIIEFAELEEYIDQPMKVYSTGMGMRLMFATSTAINPEILVLDEVLGVGDAYFSHKSYDRIEHLCKRRGTTVLLVTHDIYTAGRICERMIWLDRGRILMDSDGPSVIKAYEDSIREQEERRLRKKKLRSLRASGEGGDGDDLLVEIRALNNVPQPCPVHFSRISLEADGVPIDSLPLAGEEPGDENGSHLILENGCWGEVGFQEGRAARPMLNYGSPFHRVSGVFRLGEAGVRPAATRFGPTIEAWAEESCDLVVRAWSGERSSHLGALNPGGGVWSAHTLSWSWEDAGEEEPASLAEINTTGVQGTGAIVARAVRLLDEDGRENYRLHHGRPATLEIDYRIAEPELDEKAQVLVALHRDGVEDIGRFITRDLHFDAKARPAGTIRMHLPRLLLAEGSYAVTVMIAEEGYYDRVQRAFYSLNSGVYCCLSKIFEMIVLPGGTLTAGTIFLGEAEWSLEGKKAQPPPEPEGGARRAGEAVRG